MFHVARGDVFIDVLEIDNDWPVFLKKVISDTQSNLINNNLPDWFTDEMFSTKMIKSYKGVYKFNFLKRPNGIINVRIDRTNWLYSYYLVKHEYYIDAHSIRPYLDNTRKIDKLRDLILNKQKSPSNNFYKHSIIFLLFLTHLLSINYFLLKRKLF